MSVPNEAGTPILTEQLGYSTTDRLLIIHADDAGMCRSVNEATIRALEEGIVTCAAVMVPCPWFPAMADYARSHPEADLGVHLTLNSEWIGYRWTPVAPVENGSGLLDGQGYLHRGVREVVELASPAEVEREIRAQIERAVAFGMAPTHVDSHMGTLFTGPFFPAYTRVAKDTGFMPMLIEVPPDRADEVLRTRGIDAIEAEARLKREGYPHLNFLSTGEGGDTLEARREAYHRAIRDLKPGVTEIIVHLSMDDPEIRAITGHWEARWNEFRIFTDPATRHLIESEGIRRIGYRELSRLAFSPHPPGPLSLKGRGGVRRS